MAANSSFTVYRYRWVVLGVFMLLNMATQILWVTYAPITGPAAEFYGVSDLKIGLLAMTFMMAFLPLSIPVSWLIDTYGFRIPVSIGAILMSVFAVSRGLSGDNYQFVLLSTIGIAISQPFFFNAWTKVPAQWFGLEERATAIGFITLSNLIGSALGLLLTPRLIKVLSIPTVQLIYGAFAVFSTVLFLLFAREKPATPPCPEGQEVRALMLDGFKHLFKVKDFWIYILVYFCGVGIYTGITTWVEGIIRPRGFTPTQAGSLGALMVIGGMLGASLIPPISDRFHKRKIFLLAGISLCIPGLIGLTYATSTWTLFSSAFLLGFFLNSTGPIGLQYAAEITYPTSEGTSNGLIQLFGQASVVFVYGMEALRSPDGAYTPGLVMAVGLFVISVILITQLHDPKPQLGHTKEITDVEKSSGLG